MRILHVIRGLANSSGTTHIVRHLSEAQARMGHRVTVFHCQKGEGESVIPDPALVDSVCFPCRNPSGHFGYSSEFAATLVRRVREFDFVHIHAVWNWVTWRAMRECCRAGIPYAVAPQGSLDPWAWASGRPLRRLWAILFEKPLLQKASFIQVLTPEEQDQVRVFGIRTPTKIIPNGVDPDAFCHPAWRTWLRKRIGVGDDQPILLFLGRIHPKKGVDLLVRAFAGVLNLHPRAILVVAGSDAGSGYLDVIRRLAETSIPGVDVPTEGDPCGSSVCFLGEVAGELKAKVLAGADVFVLSSHSEGLPVAVLEAMASGLPVVITPGCHLPEVPAAGAGLLVEPSLDDMVRGLDRLLTDPRARGRMGEQGQRLVKEKFSWTGIAKQTVEAYQGQG